MCIVYCVFCTGRHPTYGVNSVKHRFWVWFCIVYCVLCIEGSQELSGCEYCVLCIRIVYRVCGGLGSGGALCIVYAYCVSGRCGEVWVGLRIVYCVLRIRIVYQIALGCAAYCVLRIRIVYQTALGRAAYCVLRHHL